MTIRFWVLCLAVLFHAVSICVQADDTIKACHTQQQTIQTHLSNESIKAKFVSEFIFTNESKPQLLLTWAGNKTLIVVVTQSQMAGESDVYRSTDDGRTFAKITDRVLAGSSGRLHVMPGHGLQHNPAAPSWVYLLCYDPANMAGASLLYLTRDGGATWQRAALDFLAHQSPLQAHPTDARMLLLQAGTRLHLSSDAGLTWRLVRQRVFKASWGSGVAAGDHANAIYAACDRADADAANLASLWRNSNTAASRRRAAERQLWKSVDLGVSWGMLADNIYSYKAMESFLFVSRADSDSTDSRHLAVSTDFGTTFGRTQLPSASSDRFFVILDVSDGLAFVHMAAGNYQGHGTLYTSNSAGRLFSKSLERHLYPPVGAGSDFYKVESMRGTYLATVLHDDSSMHSVITHNRGAVWRPLSQPQGSACKDAGKPCSLQVASSYSLSRGVLADPPMSVASAPGLVVVHGNAAASLQTGDTAVYVSSDGGHAWSSALAGPHHVQIGNNGNYLVAVPMGHQSPQVVKFSTDAGRCWHSYQFTSENYTFTGLLTEPGNRALTVAIWGYVGASHHWRVFVIDLAQLLRRPCTDADYEPWMADGAISGGGVAACLLGAKETIRRLRPESMCASAINGAASLPAKELHPCQCTQEDFECEYGYTRPVNSLSCLRDPEVATPEVCDADTVSRIVTDGYRKLPGNRCEGGFQPNKTRQVLLRTGPCPLAQEDPRIRDGHLLMQQLEQQELQAEASKTRRTIGLVVPMCITGAILLAVVFSLVVLARLRERRRRRLAFHYSAVSSAGRRSDNQLEADLEYQPADGILRNGGPKPRAYSATGATAGAAAGAAVGVGGASGKRRSDDKRSLLAASAADEEDDDAPIF